MIVDPALLELLCRYDDHFFLDEQLLHILQEIL